MRVKFCSSCSSKTWISACCHDAATSSIIYTLETHQQEVFFRRTITVSDKWAEPATNQPCAYIPHNATWPPTLCLMLHRSTDPSQRSLNASRCVCLGKVVEQLTGSTFCVRAEYVCWVLRQVFFGGLRRQEGQSCKQQGRELVVCSSGSWLPSDCTVVIQSQLRSDPGVSLQVWRRLSDPIGCLDSDVFLAHFHRSERLLIQIQISCLHCTRCTVFTRINTKRGGSYTHTDTQTARQGAETPPLTCSREPEWAGTW